MKPLCWVLESGLDHQNAAGSEGAGKDEDERHLVRVKMRQRHQSE